MNRLFANIAVILCVTASVIAQDEMPYMDVQPMLLQSRPASFQSADNAAATLHYKCRQRTESNDAEPLEISVKTSRGGELAELLGDNINLIDALHVEGPINDADFNTLWSSSFNGKLKVIDLGKASVGNNIIPDNAFFHTDEQVDWGTLQISTIWLEKMVLPEGITEIGEFAFAYATTLTEVNFPASLRIIGPAAFTDCIRLTTDQLKFGDNLEKIGNQTFYQCQGLTGSIHLPESVKCIDEGAFYRDKITGINFPASLEYLGCMAFAGSKLKTAILPDNCYLCPEGSQFYNSWELAEVHLPDNLAFVPRQVVGSCQSLTTVNVPRNAVVIGEFAYDGTAIDHIDLPPTVETIGQDAFQGCDKLKTIVLPPSLKKIGNNVFNLCYGLESIYCMAGEPPVCTKGMYDESNPFTSLDAAMPVYIPVGTREKYLSAPGWDFFSNYIETNDFPYAGIGNIVLDETGQDDIVYDLSGRKADTLVPGNVYIRNGKKFIHK